MSKTRLIQILIACLIGQVCLAETMLCGPEDAHSSEHVDVCIACFIAEDHGSTPIQSELYEAVVLSDTSPQQGNQFSYTYPTNFAYSSRAPPF